MITGLFLPQTQARHLVSTIPRITEMLKPCRVVNTSRLRFKSFDFREGPYRFRTINTAKAAEQNSGLVHNDVLGDYKTVLQIKAGLNQALQGINRGIFGATSEKKSEIEGLVMRLESQNPTPDLTENLDKVSGCWRLIYSTITILGVKRTKLGLRDFVTLGDFFQTIDVSGGKAVNVIEFNVRGFKMLNGHLRIESSFNITSKSRVDIKYETSTIIPDQLMSVFRKNYDLLLGIFNPEGWLEISYVDESTKIGRDDKGNLFILERFEQGT